MHTASWQEVGMDLLSHCSQGIGTALFDMDGTLFDGDLGESAYCLHLIAEYLGTKAWLLSKEEVRSVGAAPGITDLQRYGTYLEAGEYASAYQMTTEYFERIAYAEVLKTCEHAFSEFQDPTLTLSIGSLSLGVFVHPAPRMLSYLQACKSPVLVSASPLAVVEAFVELNRLGEIPIIAATESIANLPYGQTKVTLAQQAGIERPFIAFGNSEGDIEMLNWAELGVLRTSTSSLAVIAQAKEAGWLLIE